MTAQSEPSNAGVEIAELQSQLAAAIAIRDEALLEVNRLQSKPDFLAESHEKQSYFLTKLPLEIRNAIYTLLLTNDSSPAILRTCHQIHSEGTTILYGSNKFLMNTSMFSSYIYSSLARTLNTRGHAIKAQHIRSIPAIEHVKHWKIIISPSKRLGDDPIPHALACLCETLCDTKLTSIEVVIVPQGDLFHPTQPPDRSGNHKLESFLFPLRILRGVSRFVIRHAEFHELPVYTSLADVSTIRKYEISTEFLDGLKLLVSGSTPASHVFKMFRNLLVYTRSFGKHPKFNSEMIPAYGRSRDFDRESLRSESGLDEIVLPGQDNWNHTAIDLNIPSVYPPYRLFHLLDHHLERALSHAGAASELNCVELFKKHRATVLELLEPQYERIVKCSRRTADLVKHHKTPSGLFTCNYLDHANSRKDMAVALVAVEQYAESFIRDMPESIELYVRANRHKVNSGYAFLPWRSRIRLLNEYLDNFARSNAIAQELTVAINELDAEYLRLREARKRLFEHDKGDWGCEIDLQLGLCDDKIGWRVHEPVLGPKEAVHYPRWEVEAHNRAAHANDPSTDGIVGSAEPDAL